MNAEIPTATTIRRMQNAALERALVRGDHDGRYVTFAGMIERLRRTAVDQGTTGLLPSLVACTVLANGDGFSVDPIDRWSPALDEDEPRLEGAILAHRRFDIDADRAARLAGRSTADVESVLRERTTD